tara:strand:- start:1627 stop:2346 length:720 start_codon:yes stop_codon:yes gene_type:complete
MKARWGACSLKLSTEDAAMSLDQIKYWARLCKDFLPVIVKIGGPNARNDIRQLVQLDVSGLIAPMVESSFGLENFMEALGDYTTPLRFKALEKHINIETATAVMQLDSILDSPAVKFIDEITVGRRDLSRSMGLSVENHLIESTVREIIQKIKKRNIKISLGGGVIPETIDGMIETYGLDQFNTRIMSFRVDPSLSYREAVYSALEFEVMALKNDALRGFISHDEEKCRVMELQKRLAH